MSGKSKNSAGKGKSKGKPAQEKPAAKRKAPVSKKSKKSAPRRAPKPSMIATFGPAAAVLAAPKLLVSVQKLPAGDTEKAKNDKTPLVIGGLAYFASTRPSYAKYAGALAVIAAVAYRRKLALSGELEGDSESNEFILAEGTPSPAEK